MKTKLRPNIRFRALIKANSNDFRSLRWFRLSVFRLFCISLVRSFGGSVLNKVSRQSLSTKMEKTAVLYGERSTIIFVISKRVHYPVAKHVGNCQISSYKRWIKLKSTINQQHKAFKITIMSLLIQIVLEILCF